MNNQQKLIGLIKSTSGQANILTIPRVYISLVGNDLEAALLLGQVVYWSDKSSRSDGWFWKKYDEWEQEIGLSQYRVKRAASKLERMGLIETKVKRANSVPTVHYRLIVDKLSFSIIEFLDNRETSFSESEETSFSESEVSQQSLTEITTETTTEITDRPDAKNASGKQPKPALPGGKTPKPKKPKDPRIGHPALVAYREVTGIHVATALRDDVIRVVGNKSEAWRVLIRDWIGRGWNKSNIDGMLEAFQHGGVKGGKSDNGVMIIKAG